MTTVKPDKQPTDHERLVTLRDRLEGVLGDPATTPRDLATVSREFRLLLAQIADSTPSTGSSKLDEIAARRRKRGA